MTMFSPSHPGHIVKSDVVEALGLSISDFAAALSMSREAMSRVLNGRAAISPDLAIRLEMAGFSNAAFWLRLQTAYDLSEARKHKQPRIKNLYQSSDQEAASY